MENNWIDVNVQKPDPYRNVLLSAVKDAEQYCLVGHWDALLNRWWNNEDYDDTVRPTHWQPLPAPPQTDKNN